MKIANVLSTIKGAGKAFLIIAAPMAFILVLVWPWQWTLLQGAVALGLGAAALAVVSTGKGVRALWRRIGPSQG